MDGDPGDDNRLLSFANIKHERSEDAEKAINSNFSTYTDCGNVYVYRFHSLWCNQLINEFHCLA